MKRIIITVCAVFSFTFLFASSVVERKDNNLITVYAYDSFCGQYGPGAELCSKFTDTTGIRVNLVSCGNAGEMINRITSEGDKCKADVIIGLPDSVEVDKSLFYSFEPKCSENLIPYDPQTNLVPFDYGILAFLYNTESGFPFIPQSLNDLTAPEYRNAVLLIDPRNSSVGLGTLMWTVDALGQDQAVKWWQSMKQNALTITDSWSMAYGLFTEGEAPFVVSYTTSPVYHMIYEGNCHYMPLEFSDGHIRIVEYMGISAFSEKKENAVLFCNYILTEGQNKIATDNSMFPANTNTVLDSAFDAALQTENILNIDTQLSEQEIDSYIKSWTDAMI